LSDIKGKQLIKIITVSATQPVGQGLELFCFCIKVAAVVDYQRQLRHGHTAYRCRGQRPCRLETTDGLGRIFPGNLLSEDGTNHYFEWFIRRPPVLLTIPL
jgi:hypothetical protein